MTLGDNFLPRLPLEGDWEVPATLNDTWGYSKFDDNWKSPEYILRLLLKIVSRGGNYLLNVGPKADGSVPCESYKILDQVGAYVKANGESIYETRRMPVYPYELDWAEFTCKDHNLYIHVLKPKKRLELLNYANNVESATLLKDNRQLDVICELTCEGDKMLTIDIPEDLREESYYCVRLRTKEKDPVFDPICG